MNFQFKTLKGDKGEAVRPYTADSDLLFTQVLDRPDAALSSILGLILVHREKIDRTQPLELCWGKMKFRAGLLEWIDSLCVPGSGVTDSASKLG
jgi:hypothetical protein